MFLALALGSTWALDSTWAGARLRLDVSQSYGHEIISTLHNAFRFGPITAAQQRCCGIQALIPERRIQYSLASPQRCRILQLQL
jgi:hypothetical protein